MSDETSETDDTGIKETQPDGIIRFEIGKISTLTYDGRYSPEVEVRGVDWKALVCKRLDKLIVVLYYITDQSTPSSIDVDSKFILLNSDTTKNIVKERSDAFKNDEDEYACFGKGLLEWDKLLDEDEGFIKEDKIVVEIHFSISNAIGIRIAPRIDFSDPKMKCHDVALVINGEKVYVNKGILSVHSLFFKAMFYGDFVERDKKEIEMKDIDRQEFIELLRVIYPFPKKITDNSVEVLIKLSDRFEIHRLLERAEDFLVYSSQISNVEKLRIAELYRLNRLKELCFSALKTKQDFKDVKASPMYSGLSSDTKAVLFELLLEVDA